MSSSSSSSPSTKAKPSNASVRVGVGVIVKDPASAAAAPAAPARIFCGIRKGSHGAGSLALPGGHLEMYESFVDCAVREVKEECDLDLDPTTMKLGHVTNDPMLTEHKHYVTIFMMAECIGGPHHQTPKTMEPEKCEGWKSYTWNELKAMQESGSSDNKLFGPLNRLLKEQPQSVLDFLGIQT